MENDALMHREGLKVQEEILIEMMDKRWHNAGATPETFRHNSAAASSGLGRGLKPQTWWGGGGTDGMMYSDLV